MDCQVSLLLFFFFYVHFDLRLNLPAFALPPLASCQTFEGGVAAVPGAEAHGGYAFCGLAALVMLGQPHLLDRSLLTVGC